MFNSPGRFGEISADKTPAVIDALADSQNASANLVRASYAESISDSLRASGTRTMQGRGSAAEHVGWAVGGTLSLIAAAHIPKYALMGAEKTTNAAVRWLHPLEGTAPIVRDYRFGDGFALDKVAKSAGFPYKWSAETVKVLEKPGVGPIGFASFTNNEALGMAVSPLHRNHSQMLLKESANFMAERGGTWMAALKPETTGRLAEFYAKKGKIEILERTPFRIRGYTAYRFQFPQS
jgi:hypothetical protein